MKNKKIHFALAAFVFVGAALIPGALVASNGFSGGDVRTLITDPTDPGRVWAGTVGGGVFLSTDGAEHWISSGLQGKRVFALALDPNDPNTVYAGANRISSFELGGVYKST